MRANDERQQEKIRKLIEHRETQLEFAVKELASSDAGQRFFYWAIFELCSIESGSIDTGIRDGVCSAIHTARNEGRKDVGRELLEMIRDNHPEQFLAMMATQINERAVALAQENTTP